MFGKNHSVTSLPHAILKSSDTRWFAYEAGVNRILEQLPALILYFTDVVSELKDDNDESECIKILQMLNDRTTKPHFEFLSYSLHVINEFNTTFQSESPLLYTLKDSVSEIIRDFSNNFMEVTYVRETNPFDIDLSSEDNYLPEENIYLGNLKFIL